MVESDIVNDCIKVFNDNKDDYFVNLNIVDNIDNYYDNYLDIKNSTLNQFIDFVKEKIKYNNDKYTVFQLKIWFYSNEFRTRLCNLRDVSDIEYYIYITNKINKNKINKLYYLFYLFTFINICINIYI